nr:hypothetical protein GCM10020092_090170 [Actinoplanes digitatis]
MDQSGLADGPPGPVDQNLQVGRRVGRRPLRPQRRDEQIVGHEPALPGGEDAQQRAHLAALVRRLVHLTAVPHDDEPAHQTYLNGRRRVR